MMTIRPWTRGGLSAMLGVALLLGGCASEAPGSSQSAQPSSPPSPPSPAATISQDDLIEQTCHADYADDLDACVAAGGATQYGVELAIAEAHAEAEAEAAALAAQPQSVQVATTTERARIRSGPACDAAVVSTLDGGVTVEITGAPDDGWVPVAVSGMTGWISAALLDGDGVPDVPTQCAPAPPATDASTSGKSSTSGQASTPSADRGAAQPADSGWRASDTQRLVTLAHRIVDDIATGDERFADRPELGASTTMDFLAGTMGQILELGAPPGVDEVEYMALVATLEEFFGRSSDYLWERPADVMNASAAYEVARANVPTLLGMINVATGQSFSIP